MAHRISGQVAADREQPALSVSVGFALYGRDGETAEMLTEAADRALYEAKGRRGGKLRVPLQGVLRLSAPGFLVHSESEFPAESATGGKEICHEAEAI